MIQRKILALLNSDPGLSEERKFLMALTCVI